MALLRVATPCRCRCERSRAAAASHLFADDAYLAILSEGTEPRSA
jgi:hypothetical protein